MIDKTFKPLIRMLCVIIFSWTGAANSWTGAVNTAVFNIIYDGVADGSINNDNIIGTGTVSYDGPVSVGSFALNSLINFKYEATFIDGSIFTTADLVTDTLLTGITVFEQGDGYGLLFSGFGGLGGGSLDAISSTTGTFLTHEFTSDINDPIGCCGGTGEINLLALFSPGTPPVLEELGDYAATFLPAPVPEPSSLALLGLGLVGVGLSRRRRTLHS